MLWSPPPSRIQSRRIRKQGEGRCLTYYMGHQPTRSTTSLRTAPRAERPSTRRDHNGYVRSCNSSARICGAIWWRTCGSSACRRRLKGLHSHHSGMVRLRRQLHDSGKSTRSSMCTMGGRIAGWWARGGPWAGHLDHLYPMGEAHSTKPYARLAIGLCRSLGAEAAFYEMVQRSCIIHEEEKLLRAQGRLRCKTAPGRRKAASRST